MRVASMAQACRPMVGTQGLHPDSRVGPDCRERFALVAEKQWMVAGG